MLDPVPWAVNGATSSADIGRVLGNLATFDGNGIRMPWDLKVEQTVVAGTQVRIAPGVAVLRNIYSGAGEGQSYIARNISETLLTIPATDSTGGATRWVILRVSDPQYGGQAPASVPDGPYVFFDLVTSITGITYPHVVLGKITQPASTATITAAMIDSGPGVRQLYQPLQFSDQVLVFPAGTTGVVMPKGAYGAWPYTGAIAMPVPIWATQVDLEITVSGVEIIGTDQAGGLRTVFDGAANTENTIIRGSTGRQDALFFGRHPVSAEQRGTSRGFTVQGNQTLGTGSIQADYQSNILARYRFTGVPV